jgi:putative peptidoglycan lipid II flippase
MTQATASAHSVRFILNTALWLTALGLVVRASGALKEIVFAGAFGVSAATDAFVVAVTYSTLVPTVIGAAVGTALIAHLARAHRDGAQAPGALRLRDGSLAARLLAAGLACAAAVYAFAPVALERVFSLESDRLTHAVSYARILSPLGAVLIWTAALDAALNAAKQFYLVALAPLLTPLCIILVVVTGAASYGVEAAAWGMLAGGLAELVLLCSRVAAQRELLFGDMRTGVSNVASTSSAGTDDTPAVFWRAVAFLSIASGVAAASALIDQIFLARLETGALTRFNYAFKVNALLISLFGTSFAAVVYPYLSDLAAARNIAGLRQLAMKLAVVVLPITAVASCAVYVFSYPIVDLLFVRGNFTVESAAEVSAIQRVFALQLVFYAAGLLAGRVLNALRASRSILLVSCAGVISVGFFDWLLYARLGAAGVAWSAVITSVVTLAASLALISLALRRNGAH